MQFEQTPSFLTLDRILADVKGELVNPSSVDPQPPAYQEIERAARFTKQIFFDCDNTLVNTEALAIEAAATVVNKCLADHGISHRYTIEELIVSYFGCTAPKMLETITEVHKFELSSSKIAEYTAYEEDLVVELIRMNPKPCSGVERVLEELHTSGKYILSVVSSSPVRRIRAALEAADMAQYFAPDQVFSAKSSMAAPKSKPDPAIYNFAMNYNQVYPWECIAFEDSRSGARSAIRAGIPCIAYIGAYGTPTHREQAAYTLKEEGCREVMHNYSQLFGHLERTEANIGREVMDGKFEGLVTQEDKEEEFRVWVRRLVRENPILRRRWRGVLARLDASKV